MASLPAPDADVLTRETMLAQVAACRLGFRGPGREARLVPGAVRSILELELDDELVAWSGDTLQSDEADRGRGALRSMVVGLAQVAEAGAVDRREVVAPSCRRCWTCARGPGPTSGERTHDMVRDRLVDLGVEVRDRPDGTERRPHQ